MAWQSSRANRRFFGEVQGKPVFGLRRTHVAAYFMAYLLVRPLVASMLGTYFGERKVSLPVTRNVPSNPRARGIRASGHPRGQSPADCQQIRIDHHARQYRRLPAIRGIKKVYGKANLWK